MFEKLSEIKPEVFLIIAVLIVISAIFFFFLKKSRQDLSLRAVVFAGIMISLSFLLSYIRLFRMPQGGTVTPASMLPLFLFAFIFGPLPGIAAGIAYGLLQLLQDAFVVHWAQLLLDYPLAFATIGIAGLFRKNRQIGIFTASVARTMLHVLSGFIFFAEYAPEGQSPLIYSLIYNGSFMAAETVITILLSFPIIAAIKRSGKTGL